VGDGTVRAVTQRLSAAIQEVVVAREQTFQLLMAAWLASGHVLLEDVPGVGKTLLAKTLARCLDSTFHRIQFTPDLLPSDITGASIFDQRRNDLSFAPGPVFANVVLADEINRATPRTQSALLEAMGEGQVTVDGITHPLPEPFLVIATLNPVESYGTFPLPESQLDRFLLSLSIGYPDRAQALAILDRGEHDQPAAGPVLSAGDVLRAQESVRAVGVARAVKEYIVDLISQTRDHPEALLGVSPRGAVALQRASQAIAAMAGRPYVLPDDVKLIAPAALAHRILTRSGQPAAARELVHEILQRVRVPVEL